MSRRRLVFGPAVRWVLLALLVMGLGLAVRLWSLDAARGYAIRADELDYAIPAQEMTVSGEYLDTYITHGRVWTRVPLEGLLLAAAFATQPQLPPGADTGNAALMAQRFAAGNLAMILVSLLLIPPVMKLAAEAFPRRRFAAAPLAGLFTALYPPLVSSASQQMLSETLFITLLFAALYTLTRWQPGTKRAVGSGQGAEGSEQRAEGGQRGEGVDRGEVRWTSPPAPLRVGEGLLAVLLQAHNLIRTFSPLRVGEGLGVRSTRHPSKLPSLFSPMPAVLPSPRRRGVGGEVHLATLQSTTPQPYFPPAPVGKGLEVSASPHPLFPAPFYLVLTGLLLGLAALARPVVLGFLPFLTIWFWLVLRADLAYVSWLRAAIRSVGLSAAVAAFFLVAISPWTLYNYQHYGRLLLLDTANITAFWNYNNFRGENLDERLADYPNPADRQGVILREGMANILERPDRFVENLLFSIGYSWHLELSSALLPNAWDLTQRDPAVPLVVWTDLAFLFVSLAGLAGLAGLGLRRPNDQAGRVRLALLLLIVFVLVLGAVIPYDARYRMPAAPALIIFAAGLLVLADWRRVFDPRRWVATLRARPLITGLAVLLCVWVIAGAVRPEIPGAIRALYLSWQASGASDVEAERLGAEAHAALPDSFWPLFAAAEKARYDGRDEEARRLYGEVLQSAPEPRAVLGLADVLYRHPDWQLEGDERTWLRNDPNQLRGAPWNSFRPTPLNRLVADERAAAYMQGFHPVEGSGADRFSWSMGRADIKLPAMPDAAPTSAIHLRISAPAIGPAEPMAVTVHVEGASPVTLQVPAGWADYTVTLDRPISGDLLIHIESLVRRPRDADPGSPDGRLLGVGLQWVER